MSQNSILPLLEDISTTLRVLLSNSRTMIAEQKKQTVIAGKMADAICSSPLLPNPVKKKKKMRKHPVILFSQDVMKVLDITEEYARKKIREIKDRGGIPYSSPLSVRTFCVIMDIPYDAVADALGWNDEEE